jgi:hypothetical protein
LEENSNLTNKKTALMRPPIGKKLREVLVEIPSWGNDPKGLLDTLANLKGSEKPGWKQARDYMKKPFGSTLRNLYSYPKLK